MRRSNGAIVGTACCIFAAVAYTVVNICLRDLADTASLAWTICVKELVTVLVMGPWVLVRAWCGLPALPAKRSLVWLITAGLAVQVVGNLGVIWAFGVLGLSITIPVALGVSLAASALLGWLLLGERVSQRSILALALLIASIVLLKLGADRNPRFLADNPWEITMGIGVVVLAGVSFASLSVAIRNAASRGEPHQGIVLIVTGMGVVTLGPLSLWQLGPAGLLATPHDDLATMLVAGVLNLVAFLAITKGLHLTTIVHANVLSASQVAMAALAGSVLFAEPLNGLITVGVVLTIVGTGLIQRPADVEEVASGM